VLAGALELMAAYSYFPPATVFLVVVDPGVGTSRRGIAVEAGGFRFVAPDNGILGPAVDAAGLSAAVTLDHPRFARPAISRTFEGRDRFAPAAAWLAQGTPLADLGAPLTGMRHVAVPRVQIEGSRIEGAVVRIDRFGNLISNIERRQIAALTAAGGTVAVRIGGRDIAGLSLSYAAAPAGALCALFSSTDHLEVAVNGGSAAAALGLGCGAPVHVHGLRDSMLGL
jgi:S-adenosylmethionine hydrolase